MDYRDDAVTAALLTLATDGFLVAGQEGNLTYPDGVSRDVLTVLVGKPADVEEGCRVLFALYDSLYATGWFSALDIVEASAAWREAASAMPPLPSSLRHARLQIRREAEPPLTNRGVTSKDASETSNPVYVYQEGDEERPF